MRTTALLATTLQIYFRRGDSDGQTVIRDTETRGHARTSDQLADMLVDANPNRFEVVPTSQYIKGIDY
jgi:hypothetical protein